MVFLTNNKNNPNKTEKKQKPLQNTIKSIKKNNNQLTSHPPTHGHTTQQPRMNKTTKTSRQPNRRQK
ncbi:hypothetical protein [Candidatus Phytoplasma solani]|uniref:hypothetical protein n=1 Tax=Candidatus Phytoplasma solani TaxID=69896 RepID=UPI00358FB3B3